MRWKAVRRIIGTVLVLALTGCSALRLSYNQAPTLAYWWLDRYADFTAEQKPRVQAALGDWLAWHRSTQLADYQFALARAQRLVQGPVTPEQVCGEFIAWQQRAETAVEQAVPAVAELVLSLSPAQVSHIQQRNQKGLQDAENDYLQPDAAERLEANVKRTLERAETLYGSLNAAQRAALADALAGSPFDPTLWLAERRARQADMLRLLRQWQLPAPGAAGPAGGTRPDAATVQAGLRRMAQTLRQSPRPAYAAYAQRLTEANCALGALVHNSTTPAQRRHAADKLKGWEDDLRVLARPPA